MKKKLAEAEAKAEVYDPFQVEGISPISAYGPDAMRLGGPQIIPNQVKVVPSNEVEMQQNPQDRRGTV